MTVSGFRNQWRRSFLTMALALLALAGASGPAYAWQACGSGQLIWTDGSTSGPVAGARVFLMDEDNIIDEQMAEGYTDANGAFNLCGNGGDTEIWLLCNERCSRPDVFVRVELENADIEVESIVGFNHAVRTAERANTLATTHDFGTFHVGLFNNDEPYHLWGMAKRSYDYFRTYTGQRIPGHDGQIIVSYPDITAGQPWTTDYTVHWPSGLREFGKMPHEFGHRIRHGADGPPGYVYEHFLLDVARFAYAQHHDTNVITNVGFAFNEGWAHYFGDMVMGGSPHDFRNWTILSGGDRMEGNVAHRLMRVSDRCGGLRPLWETLRTSSVHTYQEFLTVMRARHPDCVAPPGPPPTPEAIAAAVGPLTGTSTSPKEQLAVTQPISDAKKRFSENAAKMLAEQKGMLIAMQGQPLAQLAAVELDEHIQVNTQIFDALSRATSMATGIDRTRGTHVKRRLELRGAFAKDVSVAWRRAIARLRGAMDVARQKSAPAQSASYIAELEQKIARVEQALAMMTKTGEVPSALLPSELSDSAVAKK